MPERQAFIDRVKGANREYSAVAVALAQFGPLVQTGAVELPRETSPRDFIAAVDKLEATYLIRMWAEFEMALRSYHEVKTGADTIRAVDLINWTAGIKQGRAVSQDVRDDVHEVREYRNFLVHGNSVPAVPIDQARKRLNTLLHCLPIEW